MNVNTANSSISNVRNTVPSPIEKTNEAFTARKTGPVAQDNQVTVSNGAKISSHLDSVPKRDKAEIESFIQGLDRKDPNLNNQMSKAPQSVREMAHKLQMNLEEVTAAMPQQESGSLANNTGSKGIAAYNAIAAQPKLVTTSPANTGASNANKALVA